MCENNTSKSSGDREWAVAADHEILRYLFASRQPSGEPSIQTPHTMYLNLTYSKKHIQCRLSVYVEHGLVERVGEGAYRLSAWGEQLMEVECEELLVVHSGLCCLCGSEPVPCLRE